MQTKYRFGSVLLAGCTVAAFVMLAGCTHSPQSERDRHLAKGKTLFEKKDYPRAIIEFKSAAQAAPKDAEVLYRLGLAYGEAGDLQSAVYAFQSALTRDPKHAAAQLRLSEIMALAGDDEIAMDAESRLEALRRKDPNSPDVLNTLAFTQLRLRQTDDAIRTLEQALTKPSREVKTSILLASARMQNKDVKGAEKALVEACSAHPQSAEARLVLGKFYAAQKKLADAEAQFRKAVEIAPKNDQALMNLGTVQYALGKKTEAEQIFIQLAKSKDPALRASHALYLFEVGRREEGTRELEKLYRDAPEDRAMRTRLVAAYQQTNRSEEAMKLLTAALQKNPKDSDALLQRGELLLAVGKFSQAETDVNGVLRLRPNAPELHYVLAKVHQARGEVSTYRQELSEAVRLNPRLLDARLEMAQALIASGSAKSALDLLGETPGAQRDSLPVYVQRNWAFWTLGDMGQMRKGIDRALTLGRPADVLIQDGMWKLRAGNYTGARAALEEALKVNPADLRALSVLADTYTAQRQGKMAVQKVKEYASQHASSAPAQEFLGLVLWANGDRSGARTAFTNAKTANPRSVSADLRLVQMDVLDRKWEDATKRLNGVLTENFGNTLARLWLANLEEYRGSHESALDNLRKVVAAEPDNSLALNNLAALLADQGKQPDEALKYAEKAQELSPDNPEYADTLGWILYRKGLYTMSVRQLERAASHRGSAVWNYHLAMAYAKAGEVSRGRTVLDAALRRNPNLPEAKMAQALFEQGK